MEIGSNPTVADVGNRLLLAVDTATEATVVALMSGEKLVGRAYNDGRRHSRVLLKLVDEILKTNRLGPRNLGALAVGVGPGSFTGVRVGVTFAKTLSVVLGIPLVGVSSLATLAASLPEQSGDNLLAAALDALKGQVYIACYAPGRWFEPVIAPVAMAPQAAAEKLAALGRPVVVAGSGATRYSRVFKDTLGRALANPSLPAPHHIDARALGALGIEALQTKGPVEPHSLEPDYCRPSDAELARRAKPA